MTHLRDLAASHPFPSLTTVRLGDIWRDPDVASIPLRMDHIDDLRESFQPHLVGIPIISRRDDGVLAVLNGSHRCEVLRQLFGDDLEVDVSLYEGMTRDQEIAIFERHHKKFLPSENRAKKNDNKEDEQNVWTFDYDGTITSAPEQTARVATGLKAIGDEIVVLTGNKSPRADLVKALSGFGFPYDELLQYDDDGTNGIGRAEYLKHLGAWGAFDNRIDRAPIFAEVCPHFYLIAAPLDDNPNGTKKEAKKAIKDLKRSLRDRFHGQRSAPFREVRGADLVDNDDNDWA